MWVLGGNRGHSWGGGKYLHQYSASKRLIHYSLTEEM